MTSLKRDETDAKTIERRCRIILNFRVQIAEITQEIIRKSLYWHEEDHDYSISQGLRQHRLLLALLNNEQALAKFLIYVITNDLERFLGVSLDREFPVEDEEKILKSVYSDMGEEDASFFEEVRSEGLLFDNTELLQNSFKLNLTGATLEQARVLTEDGPGN